MSNHANSTSTRWVAVRRLYQNRQLIQVLVARELKIRYRGAVLGFLWSFLNPIIFMLVYILIFSVYMRVDVENYPAFLLTGLLPWLWFSGGLIEATTSIISNSSLVKSVQLPSEIFPLVSISTHFAHFLLSIPILLLLLFAFGINISWKGLLLPPILLVQFVLTFGLALITSALATRFRDILHIVPTLLMVWFFMTPVLYPADLIPAAFKFLLIANPMAYLITAYQDILFRQVPPSFTPLLAVAVGALAIWAIGHLTFQAHKDIFAEQV